jgi:hypothetical protein
VTCASGCACKDAVLDGHTAERTSQTRTLGLQATQAGECVLQVRVAAASASGEHKVKIMGAAVAEQPGEGRMASGLDTGTTADSADALHPG